MLVQALYDYSRRHTDELTFKKGDILTVSQQVEGGWWEGSLNGIIGWFPSNYVMCISDLNERDGTSNDEKLLVHLHNFQDEIIQHVLEGELRQVNELSQLLSIFLINLEPLLTLPFLDKLVNLRDLLSQTINMHQTFATALDEMRRSYGPKRMGGLFLDFAPTVNAIGCDYSKIHLHIVTGLEKNVAAVTKHMNLFGINFQMTKCKQQLSLVFERLNRYPLLLKEMERYLEEPHIDRGDILRALHVYGEITERCAILRKFKEFDVDVLLSTINGWQGQSIQQLGDPILTLRVLLITYDGEFTQLATISKSQLSLIMIFPNCVLLLARTNQPDVYDFITKIPLHYLTVVGSVENATDLDLIVAGRNASNNNNIEPTTPTTSHLSLACTDQNARDLLVSTLTDLIHYQMQIEQFNASQSNVVAAASSSSSHVWSREQKGLNESRQLEQLPRKTATSSSSNTAEELNSKSNILTRSNPGELSPKLAKRREPVSVMSSTTTATTTTNPVIMTTITDASCSVAASGAGVTANERKKKSVRPLTGPATITNNQDRLSSSSPPTASATIVLELAELTSSTSALNTTTTTTRTTAFAGIGLDKPPSHHQSSHNDTNTLPSGIRFLPHQITTNAHVGWFDTNDCKTAPQENSIRCLRLDGPKHFAQDEQTTSTSGLNNLCLTGNNNNNSNAQPQTVCDDNCVSLFDLSNKSSTHAVNPNLSCSPKAESRRRKRIDRHKSAINPEDVLRSIGKMHETERRTVDDAKILQVIEAYCTSCLIQHSCRSLESCRTEQTRSNSSGSNLLSSSETKTLIQHFQLDKPKTAEQSSISTGTSTTTTTTTVTNLKNSRQSLPQSFLSAKSSFKRSDVRANSQPANQQQSVNCASRNNNNDKDNNNNNNNDNNNNNNGIVSEIVASSSLSQSLLPPVILPTRSGRRL